MVWTGNLWSDVVSGLACHTIVTGSTVTVDGGWPLSCVKKAGSFAR